MCMRLTIRCDICLVLPLPPDWVFRIVNILNMCAWACGPSSTPPVLFVLAPIVDMVCQLYRGAISVQQARSLMTQPDFWESALIYFSAPFGFNAEDIMNCARASKPSDLPSLHLAVADCAADLTHLELHYARCVLNLAFVISRATVVKPDSRRLIHALGCGDKANAVAYGCFHAKPSEYISYEKTTQLF